MQGPDRVGAAGDVPAAWAVRALVAALIATSAATPVAAAEADEEDVQELAEVVVTGSRIQRRDYTANSPVVTVDEELFSNTSTVGIETVLNQLPQFAPAATMFSSTTLQAQATTTPGASIVSLRGLGSFRTLTLIDGRRATPLNATLNVDTNSIPSSAVERVEIISGGASAVYGADAVAGVVNFILKDRFQGLEFNSRYGITEEGDGEELQISALMGTLFADGRGNVMVGAEYSDRGKAYDINRNFRRRYLDDAFTTGTEAVLPETYVDFSIVPASQRPTPAAISNIFGSLVTDPCNLLNGPLGPDGLPTAGSACPPISATSKYFVNRSADGTGSLFTGGAGFGSTNGNAGSVRYNGSFIDPRNPDESYRKVTADGILRENNLEALTTVPLERYSMFAKGEYEFADNVSAYLRGNVAHSRTATATTWSPAVNNWVATIPVGFEGTLYAPSLAGDGSTRPEYVTGGLYGLNCPATGGCTESQAFPLPPELESLLRNRTDANADMRIQRVMDYLPKRATSNRVTTLGLNVGLQGRLMDRYNWDAGVSWGATEAVTLGEGFADMAQYKAVVESPNYGVGFLRLGLSPTSAGVGQCTTGLPIFRSFDVSQDCIDTIAIDTQATSQVQQRTADINLTGPLLQLPAGDLQFAIGADWRKWDYDYINDHLNSSNTFASQVIGVFAQGDTHATLNTKEVYGELLIPLLRDLPLINQLELELGGRYSDYSTSGGVETYKVLANWSLTPWARLRGGYNRATRAPHLAEQFLGRSQVTVVPGDPCSRNQSNALYRDYSANPTYNPDAAQVEALCRSLMTSLAADVYYTVPLTQQPGGVVVTTAFQRGNANVDPETAQTWTAGLILSSPFSNPWASGLSLTADWYSIRIDDIIALESINEVWRQCILSNAASSSACNLVGRDPFDGRLSRGELTYTNEGWLMFEGVDLALNWRARFADLGLEAVPGSLAFNTQMTFPTTRKTRVNPTAPVRDWTGTTGCEFNGVTCTGYDYQAFTSLTWSTGPASLSVRWNHYPTIDDASAVTNPGAANQVRGVFESYNVFSLAGTWDLTSAVTLRAGIDNLFDVEPPLSGGSFSADGDYTSTTPPSLPTFASPSGDSRYDQLGRRYFLGVNVKL